MNFQPILLGNPYIPDIFLLRLVSKVWHEIIKYSTFIYELKYHKYKIKKHKYFLLKFGFCVLGINLIHE